MNRETGHTMKPKRAGFLGMAVILWMGPGAEPVVLAKGGVEDKARLLSVRLAPQEVRLRGVGASQRLLVMGRFSDGLERDVTSESQVSLSGPRIAEIAKGARLVAVADGQGTVKASYGGLVARTTVRIEGSNEKRPFSFGRDLGAIFTKRGCNSSDCHGSVKGKGGLKLSANALYPREDYKWIVEGGIYQVLSAESGGPKIPRVNLKEPEQSVLLQKPTMSIAHGGGQRFGKDSADYATILEWVRGGAPYGDTAAEEGVRIEKVEVYPSETVLDGQGAQQLLVTAQFSNGQREDITDQVLYQSNNSEVVEVSETGRVRARKTGETAVLIRAAGHALSATIGVIEKAVSNYPVIERNNVIDEHIFTKLKKFNIVPSEVSSDGEFLRRVCLDVTGTLPPPERVREFLSSRDARKRDKLIDVLLNSPEYVDYWTFRFADLYRVGVYPNNGNPKESQSYWEWIRSSVSENKPYNEIAQERLAPQGYEGASRHYLPYGSVAQVSDVVAEEIRVFMGRRLDCAQCHNHPFESWSQDQFWGVAGFFGPLTSLNGLIIDDHQANAMTTVGNVRVGGGKVIHPRTKKEVEPAFLDGRVLPKSSMADPRLELAKWMTSHPYFAEATVNRMWGYFFGRGIVDPVDDFRSTNPPTHPDLLEALSQDFRQHGYDLKRLIRLIAQSKTYQLSSAPRETNKDDRINYSRAVPRPLDAEVLLDAICQVTGVPEVFHTAINLKDRGEEPPGTRAINLKEPDRYPSRFLEIYGRSLRLSLPDRNGQANLGQALHMLAGSTYTKKLSEEGSRVDRLLKSGASNREVIEELCLAALSRFPTREEHAKVAEVIRQRSSRREAIEDLLWGLISSREFAENH